MNHIVCVCLCVQAFSLMCMQPSKHFIQVFRGPGLSRGRINPSGDKTMCTGNTHSSFNERERRGCPLSTHTYMYTHIIMAVSWCHGNAASWVHPPPPPKSNPAPGFGGSERCTHSRRQTHTHLFRQWSMHKSSQTSESTLSVISLPPPRALGMLKRHGKLQAYMLFVKDRGANSEREAESKPSDRLNEFGVKSKNNNPQICRRTVRL